MKEKKGIESLSGLSMDDVNVHVNSSKPAQLQGSAYAQGSDIHLVTAPDEQVPHKSWHVIQQQQGKVQPVLQMKGGGTTVNDDTALEQEADKMGNKAMGAKNRELH